ncbi:MAG: ATP-binding protein [Candidatus Micrarchaeota archaeon]
MKGTNPFPLWGETPQSIIGRNNEIDIFNSYLNAVSSGTPVLVLSTGGPGSGKTLLFRRLRRESIKEGLASPYIKIERGESESDLVNKLHQEMIGFLETQEGERARPGRYSASINALRKRSAGTLEGFSRAAASDLGGVMHGIMFFIDDFDNLRKSEDEFQKIASIVSRGKLPVGFALSSTRDYGGSDPVIRRFALSAFTEHDVLELVDKALGKGPPKMGEQCLKSIMADSGGNPRLVKTSCWMLYERLKETDKIITKGHYLAALPALTSMLGREWFGPMYSRTPESERKILKVLAREGKQMHISDVATAMGKPLGPTTALAKRLLDRGQILRMDRGVYLLFSRLYGRYVLSMS